MLQGDPEAAAGLLARALAERPVAAERPDVLLKLAEAEAMRGNFAAEGHVTRALELLTDPGARVPALRVMSRISLVAGNQETATAALQELLDGLGSRDGVAQQILAEYLTTSRFTAPLLPEVTRRLAPILEAARLGEPPTDPSLLAHVVLDLAMQGERPDAVRALAERASAADPLVDLGSHGMPMEMLVQALCCVDELATAERIADAALIAARRRGSFFAASVANYHRAIPRYHRGALAETLADLHQALAPSREGWTSGAVWSQALVIHARLERGELAEAAEMLGRVAARPESMDRPIALFAQARLALARHDPVAALADALEGAACSPTSSASIIRGSCPGGTPPRWPPPAR